MIELEVNGQPYSNFLGAVCENRLDALTNVFSFEATSTEDLPLPFTGGEPCRVLVDGEPVLTGSIEIVGVNYSSQQHTIRIQGRGKTGDLLDSTLDSISDIRPPINLKALIERVIQELGLDIQVIVNTPTEDFNEAEDLAGPDIGENAFAFIEKYARKRQVLLTEDGDGNIVITQSSGESINSPLQNVLGSPNNNILAGSVSYDYTGRYNKYKFASAQNPIPLVNAGETDLTSLVNQGGGVQDPASRVGRQLVLVAEAPYSNAQCDTRAEWEANIRKTRSRVYSVDLDGFRNAQGDLWESNKIVSIVDQFAGINSQMLINSVTFTYNNSDGSLTTLALVERNSYTLTLEEPQVDKTGTGLFPQ